MPDREKVIRAVDSCFDYWLDINRYLHPLELEAVRQIKADAIAMMKEQEKKQIKLHKKHVITWGPNDEFSMRKLYEEICETLLDEGELFIARKDDHEKVDFVFYVAEGGEVNA